MARVTVEDCIEKIENRFDLVLMAAHRARMISAGAAITVDRDNDKNPVVSLREIGDGAISPDDLREDLIGAQIRADGEVHLDGALAVARVERVHVVQTRDAGDLLLHGHSDRLLDGERVGADVRPINSMRA